MLAEALVIFSCVNSTGCKETSAQYYSTHPELKEMVEHNEYKIKKYLGPTIIQVYGPMIYVVAGGTGTVRLNKFFSLQLSSQKTAVLFSKDF